MPRHTAVQQSDGKDVTYEGVALKVLGEFTSSLSSFRTLVSAPLRSRLSNYPGESFRLGPNWNGPHFPTACDQQRALEPHLLSVPEVFDTVLMTPFL